MSHYPSTKELAAFRRSIALGLGLGARYMSHPTGAVAHPPDGAWPHERRHGIGYRESDPEAMCIVRADGARHTGSVSRERASAMRSRAYARMDMGLHDHPGANDVERLCGVPLWKHTEMRPTAAGFWDDESPRSPLPVTYHNPVTIQSEARS